MKGFPKASAKICLTAATVMLVGLLGACAPQTVDSGDGALVSWSPDADCITCHTEQGSSYADTACTASKHATLDCTSCHEADDELTSVHEGVTSEDKMPKKISKTEVSDETCLSCHGSYEELATKTADYVDLVDINDTAVNPHDLPETEEHGERVCGDCHKMHEPDQDMAKSSMQYCRSCHHEDVFECNTCHNH